MRNYSMSLPFGVIIILAIAITSFPVYSEDDVIFNQTIRTNEVIKVDKQEFTFKMQSNTYIGQVISKYFDIILAEEDCKSIGYYTFCLGESERDEIIEYADIRLSIAKKEDCPTYYDFEYVKDCKANVGEYCVEDDGCISNECLHGICTFKRPICGDGFCDEKEKCKDDCNLTVTSANNVTFMIDVRKGWQKLNITLLPGKVYTIKQNANYKYNVSEETRHNYAGYYENQTNCIGIELGKPAMNLCGKCVDVSRITNLTVNKNCSPSVMINDYLLTDNTGNYGVTIIDPTKPSEPVEIPTEVDDEVENATQNSTPENVSGNTTTISTNANTNLTNKTSAINATNNAPLISESGEGKSASMGLIKILLAVSGVIILFSIIFAIVLKRKDEKEDDEAW